MLDQLGEPVVHPVHRAGQQRQHLVGGLVVELAQQLDRGRAGHVAERRAADAVGDDEQPLAGVAGVLVVLAVPAHVAERGEAQPQSRRLAWGWSGGVSVIGYFFSSRVVLPTRTFEPSWMAVAWVSRWVPM